MNILSINPAKGINNMLANFSTTKWHRKHVSEI